MQYSEERRRFLKLAGAFFSVYGLRAEYAWASTQADPRLPETFAAFLDVLLPRDEWSGSATDLQVDVKLLEFTKDDPRFGRLVDLGCHWLNMTGGPPFARLTSDQQVTVVEWMSKSDWNEIPRRFYELVRQVAVGLYYGTPAAWHGLAIKHPPQPLGYPPPWS